jgi:hypothetical protein
MMKTSKYGTLFLISIMALAGVTAGYALWEETLTITGTVDTGDFDIEITAGETGSDETIPTSTILASSDGSTLTIDIDDAYPAITYYANFSIENVGDIPAEFPGGWVYVSNTVPGGDSSITITPYAPSGAITATTLEAADIWNGKLEVLLPDTAGEGASYSFTITVDGQQTT